MSKTKLPAFSSYMSYSSDNYGAHSLMFTDADGNEFYFSYKTLVAFRSAKTWTLVVHENDWGTTTGKHLNAINPDKKTRLKDADFQAAFQAAFGRATP